MVTQIQYELDNEVVLQDLEEIEQITDQTAYLIKMVIMSDKKKIVFPLQKLVFGGRNDFVSFMYRQIRDMKEQIQERQIKMFDTNEPLG